MKLQRNQQRRWGVVLAAALLSGMAMAQGTSPTVKDDLFAGTEKFAKGASDVTEVTMDPDTLDMVGGKDARRAHNMVLNVVRTYEYDKRGMYNIADVEEFRQKLNTGDWHCSVHTRDFKSGESTDICNKHRADGMVEQAIITVEPKELTFIHTVRRRNGEDGSLEDLSLPGMGGLSGLPPAAMMAMMRPEMNAQMLASMAEMRAHQAEMRQGLSTERERLNSPEFKLQMDKLNSPEFKLEMEKLNSPEFKLQMEHSAEQMKLWREEVPQSQDEIRPSQEQNDQPEAKPSPQP